MIKSIKKFINKFTKKEENREKPIRREIKETWKDLINSHDYLMDFDDAKPKKDLPKPKKKHYNKWTVKENPNKYVYKTGTKWKVQKYLNGKNETFGYYSTIEEALKVRDDLEDNNWKHSKPKKKYNRWNSEENPNRYITKVGTKWKVQKQIHKKHTNFGHYSTIIEAKAVRDNLIANNWNQPVKTTKKAYKQKIPTDNGSTNVPNRTNSKSWQSANKCYIDPAMKAKEDLNAHNWNEFGDE